MDQFYYQYQYYLKNDIIRGYILCSFLLQNYLYSLKLLGRNLYLKIYKLFRIHYSIYFVQRLIQYKPNHILDKINYDRLKF